MPVEQPQYPVNLVVADRSCLVVGGGAVAERKIEGLLACGARVHVVAPEVAAGLAGRPGVTVERRPYRPGDATRGWWLVLTATDDPEVNAAVAAEATAAGVWVNSADDPDNCTFTLPSVVRQGPILVAVGTGGHSPALAVWLKRHVADQLGPEYEVLLELLAEARAEVAARGVSTEDLDWQSALDSGMLDEIRSGRVERARELLHACLSSS